MQGTIKEWDETTGQGSLVTDDRREVAIDERSGEPDAYRSLRFGQRVRFDLEESEGAAVARSLRLVTFE